MRIVILIAALGSGLIAGTFFVFSVAIMGALGRMTASEGMRAMQSINVVILNPLFLGVFLGAGLVSAILFVAGVFRFGQPGWKYLIAGSVLYIVGSILVTIVFNVPMNNTLAAADPASPAGQEAWRNYLANWTFWNHVRTIASLASSAAFILGLYFSR
ncbi:MAG: DUF1772 domain-containing protein [Pyrinomonadaceae bacterium]